MTRRFIYICCASCTLIAKTISIYQLVEHLSTRIDSFPVLIGCARRLRTNHLSKACWNALNLEPADPLLNKFVLAMGL